MGEAAVVAVPSAKWGERPLLVVALKGHIQVRKAWAALLAVAACLSPAAPWLAFGSRLEALRCVEAVNSFHGRCVCAPGLWLGKRSRGGGLANGLELGVL